MNRIALCIIALAAANAAQGSPLAQEPVVFQSGNWNVHRGVDQMTDKISCTGVYKDKYSIQLGRNDLFIGVRAPKGYTLRVDDEQPTQMTLASDIERQVNAIDINGVFLQRVLDAKRLRYSAYTILDRIEEGDLDLSGMAAAHSNILADCPGDPIGNTKSTEISSACNAILRAKLNKKLSAADVAEVCDS